MKRLVLVMVLAVAASACGGAATGPAQPGAGQTRALAAPDVEPGPTTTLKPLERIVLGEQPPIFEPAQLGTVFDPAAALAGGGGCTEFFSSLLDPQLWADDDMLDSLAIMLAPFGAAGSAVIGSLQQASLQDLDGLLDALEAMDTLTLAECGVPGGGMFFLVAGTTVVERVCVLEGTCVDELPPRSHVHSLPCLLATGLGWGDMAQGIGPVYAPVVCDTTEDLFWDPYEARWYTSADVLFGN